MKNAPLIGITLDHEEADAPDGPARYSKFPWYALRQNYADSVVHAGGLPIGLPHEPGRAEEYLDCVDGIVVTGGAFDVDPALFGAADRHETVVLKEHRTAFETALIKGAMERDMPILGICGGQQLLAVVLGCTLIQHIPDEVPDSTIAHEQPNPRDEVGHEVTILTDSLLYDIVGEARIGVNSAHHQAVKEASGTVLVNARSDDGVIEGIEAPDLRFCLGVQWHPEFLITAADERIMAAFVEACRA